VAFSDDEKTQIRYFLSYPSWVALAQSIQLGYPAASQPLFLVEDAFKRLTPQGEYTVRRALCECLAIEAQMSEARRRFKATKVGEVELNPHESRMLRKELLYWVTRLADGLGVVSNPYSQMMYQGISGMGSVGGRSVGS
jgi:hypothetical protein